MPRELEKLLSGLIEKLEWVQLTHTDHAALGHLEDRIAQLIKRFDASDARLGNLEAVERGLADLLVHLDKIARQPTARPKPGLKIPLGGVDAIEREVAEIKRSERRTQDLLEAVHGAVEHVVDRLAMIESDMHRDVAAASRQPADAQSQRGNVAPMTIAGSAGCRRRRRCRQPPSPHRAAAAAPRPPIDPNLPPDHPLEPGSAAGPRADAVGRRTHRRLRSRLRRRQASRSLPSRAKSRISSPPRAAPRRPRPRVRPSANREPKSPRMPSGADRKPSRLRKLIVAGGAVLIAIGCLHIASRMFQDGGPDRQTAAAVGTGIAARWYCPKPIGRRKRRRKPVRSCCRFQMHRPARHPARRRTNRRPRHPTPPCDAPAPAAARGSAAAILAA